MRRALFAAAMLLALVSCTSIDKEIGSLSRGEDNRIHRFHATLEQSAPETKVYADEDLKLLWNAGDLITVFNQNTYNSKFEFMGEDGDNSADFDDVTPSGLHSGNPLNNIYAVYPYSRTNKINNAGTQITLTMPAEQQYKEHSFGIGANTMVAVTDNSFLAFKNVGGYLQLRLYGDNVKVSSITIKGNNGEKIAGKASVAVGLGVTPSVTMDGTATDEVTLVCNPPVEIGTSATDYTDFWFVVPPTTFSGGFTITVTDELGGTFAKTTTKSLTIARSTMEYMSALKVVPSYDNVFIEFEDANFKAYCVENFDTSGDGEISVEEARVVTAIDVNTETITSLQGVEYFTNLRTLKCQPCYNGANHYSDGSYTLYYDGEEVKGLLTTLNIANNTALTTLYCDGNLLTSLDVSNNTALTSLDCSYNKLSSLDLSNNTALSYLSCTVNQLTSLDLSTNTALTMLYCYNNPLTRLDVSNNTALIYLWCNNNQLVNLDVSNNTALIELYCGENQLTSLDVSNNTVLIKLVCRNNRLTSLDVSNNTALDDLDCYNNQLTSLDVSDNTALTGLSCGNNQLTSLDVSKNTALRSLSCRSNQLNSLEVSNNASLTALLCADNPLTSLDVSNNTALTTLWCYNNQLTWLDVGNNTALYHLLCNDNQLTSLDVSNNPALNILNCTNNPVLTEIWLHTGQTISTFEYDTAVATIKYKMPAGEDNEFVEFEDANFKAYCVRKFDRNGDGEISIAEAQAVQSIDVITDNITSLQGIEYFTGLRSLYCRGSYQIDGNSTGQLSEINISNNTALTYLWCDYNQLTSLDVSSNTALTYLFCEHNQLSSLDVDNNTALKELRCGNNQLTSLDVSNNTALIFLRCHSNQLASLDVDNNTMLDELLCSENQLTSLDVSNNITLLGLYCANNQLTSLDLSNNTSLTEVLCDNNQLTSLDVSNNTMLTSLNCSDNQLSSLDVSNNTALTDMYCNNNPYLTEIWLKTGQTVATFQYDTGLATIYYKD